MDPRLREVTRRWTLAVPAVSAFVTSLVGDFQDRDDVLQDTAVAIMESFDQYDPDRPFLAWALGVAATRSTSISGRKDGTAWRSTRPPWRHWRRRSPNLHRLKSTNWTASGTAFRPWTRSRGNCAGCGMRTT